MNTTTSFDLARSAARGFGAGVLATGAMTAVMLAFREAGLMGRVPPRLLVERTLGRLGLRRRTSSRTRGALTALAHAGFGGTSGALFEIARSAIAARRGSREPTGALVGAGVAYATAVWAVSYAGWIPLAGLMRRPSKDRPGRPTSMVIAHWVFGASLAGALRLVERGTRIASQPAEVNP